MPKFISNEMFIELRCTPTQGSNPGLAEPRQFCSSHVRASLCQTRPRVRVGTRVSPLSNPNPNPSPLSDSMAPSLIASFEFDDLRHGIFRAFVRHCYLVITPSPGYSAPRHLPRLRAPLLPSYHP